MRAYQMTGRGGGVRESAVKWSGKNEFLSVKSQGISFQTKSGHPDIKVIPETINKHNIIKFQAWEDSHDNFPYHVRAPLQY